MSGKTPRGSSTQQDERWPSLQHRGTPPTSGRANEARHKGPRSLLHDTSTTGLSTGTEGRRVVAREQGEGTGVGAGSYGASFAGVETWH